MFSVYCVILSCWQPEESFDSSHVYGFYTCSLCTESFSPVGSLKVQVVVLTYAVYTHVPYVQNLSSWLVA